MGSTITATLMTRDSLATLPSCLASLGFCDELVVVDDGSVDGTWELLTKEAADETRKPRLRAFQHKLESFPEQRRFLQEQVRTDWILIVDADEEAMPELGAEVRALLAGQPEHRVYNVPLKNFLPARWRDEGWYWINQKRLVKVREVTWPDTGSVHAPAKYEGGTGQLKHGLNHRPFDSFDHMMRKQLSYGRNGGQLLRARGEQVGFVSLTAHVAAAFLKFYVVKGLFRFGTAGLIASFAQAVNAFTKYSVAWELQSPPRTDAERFERKAVPLEDRR